MNPPIRLKRGLQRALRHRGYALYRLTAEERAAIERRDDRESLDSVFGPSLDRLQELRRRYSEVDLPVAIHSVWGARKTRRGTTDIGWGGVDLRNFRGHSAYVWDYGSASFEATNLKFYLFTEAVRRKDRLGLLGTLTEDGAFGCSTYEYEGTGPVSRDLLDSVVEINFLDKHVGVVQRDDLRVLDIGAGYGRLAHRMLEAQPRIQSFTCVDAVPESTFLCEFYLAERGLEERVSVVPLDELTTTFESNPDYNLAINVHSFSECTYAAVEWWLQRLVDLEVRHLMIVPNNPAAFLSLEVDHRRRDYAPLLDQLGFKLVAQEPVFDDPQVQALIGVRDNMFLFERC
ncbi:putative sugar O-methyltransferase [Nocardioides immobilis]|uniref:putative sugar O-methyltransferase n=1 Tax=Nocardioides immobilis TaxID=2049295 RepID=UPI0015FE1BB7|nr:putative sugar O-methyltransferase [Nocardioides immobilis]